MDELIYQSTARSRFNTLLMAVFAGTAIILAAIGIYGLMTYTAEQRTQEIGVMLALGAEPWRIRRMIITQGMTLALAGIGIGLLAAVALARLMVSFLFGVSSRDPFVFITVPLIVGLVSLVSVLRPAFKAGRVDVAEALRWE